MQLIAERLCPQFYVKMNNRIIVFFVGKLNTGGAGKMVRYVANVCKDIFYQVHVVSFYEEMIEETDGVSYYGMNIDTSSRCWRLSALKKIYSYVSKHNPDVCCSFVSDVAFMTRLATLLQTKMTFISAERCDPYKLPKVWKVLVSWAYKHSDFCLFQLPLACDFFGKSVQKKSFVKTRHSSPVTL